MSSAAARIRSFIADLAERAVFTTQQVLNCGSRNAVDIMLCRLVKEGVIKRLARGVYVCISPCLEIPSPGELARIKAERFGRRILEASSEADRASGDVFLTDGARSSFDSVHGRLRFKHVSAVRVFQSGGFRTAFHADKRTIECEHVLMHEVLSQVSDSMDGRLEGQLMRLACNVFRLVIGFFETRSLVECAGPKV